MNDEKIKKLLVELAKISEKLNTINDAINEVNADGEDVIPGHDEGSEYWARTKKYEILMEQARLIKVELRKLGYKKV